MTSLHAPRPVDVATDPHLHDVFEPALAETDATELAVEGELPIEMDGLFLRDRPNPRFTPLDSYVYPLEGDGMVHGLWVRLRLRRRRRATHDRPGGGRLFGNERSTPEGGTQTA